MKTIHIDSCAFGTLVIDGRTYTEDLMLLPDGKILEPWWRKRGHQLTMDDIEVLIRAAPEVIVVGTGVSAGMKPDKHLESGLAKRGIKLIAAPNEDAIRVFNALAPEKRVAAGFHLTC